MIARDHRQVSVMADLDLTQDEADALLQMEKRRADVLDWDYPSLGGSISIPLVSTDGREQFLLDLRVGGIQLAKRTYQNRARRVVILARLDSGGPPHRNPDDADVPSPHLHLYREGYGDKWAFPVPSGFADLANPLQTLGDFLRYCGVTEPPSIRARLV